MDEIMEKDGHRFRLVWEDHFEGDTLDTTKWALCPERERQDAGGWWSNEMTEIRDSNLWLWAKIDGNGVPRSGGIRSKGVFEQAYGYFECRMMFQHTTGFWGAFWMMCGDVLKEDGSGESGVEIDIVESGYCATREMNHAFHWDGYRAAHKCITERFSAEHLYEGWHTYGMAWTKDEYLFYIDGKLSWRTVGPGICRFPGYMKLTTEFGKWAAPIVPEKLPDCCRVDWVRVYELAD